ncbi:beta/gamma crystallin-related protein [Spartinivicinus poritis]|uniref:Beta/gamma crystallin-related protein n=1 Tax=Spartinivicinus poritis TaxID=2994640 RepID=A0ABT5UAF2_9GAMM|nr:beta/gamma crystallin-related protein [Spartinivicinus sp. A2-2]MDE1463345.1 beta/gamma crystallin-related protein [Spartinivicinus sp. A2-2]
MQKTKFLLSIPVITSLVGCVIEPQAVAWEYYEPQTSQYSSQAVYQTTSPKPKRKRVTLFRHCDFQGNYANLKRGKYNLAKLNRYGILNDDVSSLYVPYGYQVTLYEHDNFQGRAITLTGNDRCLVNNGFNDKVSSLIISKVRHAPQPQQPYRPYNPNLVTAYQHCKFKGYRSSLRPGYYNLQQLRQLGIKNDDISSFSVPRGYEVTLYEHDNFKGRSITLQSSDKCLVNNGFNDKLSSLVVRKVSYSWPITSKPPATVYQHCNFDGYGVRLAPGHYNLRQLRGLGIRNDDLSSIRVPYGVSVTLYEHDNFRGRAWRLNSDTSCLVSRGANDQVSSIVVE